MREAFESFYEDISGHKPYWWPETEDYSPKLASIAWEAWQAALQHPQPAVPEGYMLVLVDDIKRLKFYLEPYDDIKPRDWVTDKQNLRRAHELLYALLSAGKENNNE